MYKPYPGSDDLPSPNTEYVLTLSGLSGGINIREPDWALKPGESPKIENLIFRNGALCSRDGQVYLDAETHGTFYAAFERPFRGFIVSHCGTKLLAREPSSPFSVTTLIGSVPANPGCFFEYNGDLFYKNRGGYFRVTLSGASLTASPVEALTPLIMVNAAPADGAGDLYRPENRLSPLKSVSYNAVENVTRYFLPVIADSVTAVTVDGAALSSGWSYDGSLGCVDFDTAPPVSDPPVNNTVTITFSKSNPAAYNSVMDCDRAAVYGGTGTLCIVLAGCAAQPNAYFWNGASAAMDPGYFPMEQYQLAGDASDPVTGFGRQQDFLAVFSSRSLGRTTLSTAEIDGRIVPDLPYRPVNSSIGCDLPRTISLVGNNLCWCSRAEGLCVLKDSSWANENTVECISGKINGDRERPGLLSLLEGCGENAVHAFPDGNLLHISAGGEEWLWDYSLSSPKDPAWYHFTGVPAAAYIHNGRELMHMDPSGRLTLLTPCLADYGLPINKLYRFATQSFGSFDRLKTVRSVILTMRPETNSRARLTYLCDGARRDDTTPPGPRNWLLVPRNLSFRALGGRGFAEVFRRRPMCRRVRHFAMELSNNTAGEDLSVVSARVFYTLSSPQQ